MKLIRNIKKILHLQSAIAQTINTCINEGLQKQKIEQLTTLTMTLSDMGVSFEKVCNEDIVVSLTTFGQRYYDAYVAIESIMQGTVKPNRIILWVSDDLKSVPIPMTLQKQMKRGLEIRFRKDIRSYTKLIYALKEFPNALNITVDDDVIYPYDTVENLVNTHLQHPNKICSNVVLRLPEHLEDCSINHLDFVTTPNEICKRYILEGFSGVLYPPHALHDEVFNESVFMDICKYADDIWFSAMAMLNGTEIVYAQPHLEYVRQFDNPHVQSVALQNINKRGESLNDIQAKAVFSKYNL